MTPDHPDCHSFGGLVYFGNVGPALFFPNLAKEPDIDFSDTESGVLFFRLCVGGLGLRCHGSSSSRVWVDSKYVAQIMGGPCNGLCGDVVAPPRLPVFEGHAPIHRIGMSVPRRRGDATKSTRIGSPGVAPPVSRMPLPLSITSAALTRRASTAGS